MAHSITPCKASVTRGWDASEDELTVMCARLAARIEGHRRRIAEAERSRLAIMRRGRATAGRAIRPIESFTAHPNRMCLPRFAEARALARVRV